VFHHQRGWKGGRPLQFRPEGKKKRPAGRSCTHGKERGPRRKQPLLGHERRERKRKGRLQRRKGNVGRAGLTKKAKGGRGFQIQKGKKVKNKLYRVRRKEGVVDLFAREKERGKMSKVGDAPRRIKRGKRRSS